MRKGFNLYFLGILIVIFIGLIIYFIRELPFSLTDVEMGLISSIFGGLISGGLTLIGVKATLDNQYKNDFKDLYPKRMMILDEEIDKMNEIISFLSKSFGKDYKTVYQNNFRKQLNDKIIALEPLIEKSTVVNGETYENTKNFIRETVNMKNIVYNIYEDFNEITGEQPLLGQAIYQHKERFIEGLNNLDMYRENLVNQLKVIDNKYKKLTGM